MHLFSSRLFFTLFLLFCAEITFAQNLRLTVNPRLDTIQTKENQSFTRSFLKTAFTYQANTSTKFYAEIFADGYLSYPDSPEWYDFYKGSLGLQELYAEYNHQSIFLKLGQQAVRWSDMWIFPSLDIWTGRRWERFLIDPIDEQLTYPSGLLVSYAAEMFSVDVFAPTRLAGSTHPTRLESSNTDTRTQGDWGTRARFNLNEWNFAVIAAQITEDSNADESSKKQTAGGSVSYAFDEFVTKFEYLQAKHENSREQAFAFGMDFFLGDWTIFPQMNVYSLLDTDADSKLAGTSTYLNLRYNGETHVFEATAFQNDTKSEVEVSNQTIQTKLKASFWTLLYSYNLQPGLSIGIYHQNYMGENEPRFAEYQELTGGSLSGIRFEYKN